jgi:hypothetical protein
LVNNDLLTTNNYFNASIFNGLPGVQKFFQQICLWNCLMNKQATQTSLFCPLSLFGSYLDPFQHFSDFFPFNKCSFLGYFGE